MNIIILFCKIFCLRDKLFFFGILNVLVFFLCEINYFKWVEIYKFKRLVYFEIFFVVIKIFDICKYIYKKVLFEVF